MTTSQGNGAPGMAHPGWRTRDGAPGMHNGPNFLKSFIISKRLRLLFHISNGILCHSLLQHILEKK